MMGLKIPDDLFVLSTMTLATANQAGEAHAAPVYFAVRALPTPREFELIFFSAPDSRHGQDLANSSLASAAMYPETNHWQEIRGLQISGRVRLLKSGSEWNSAWEVFKAKFPFVAELENIIRRNALYAMQPTWVRLVDNRRGFGYKQEWTLDVDR
jgi:uncharacterized protein YhbP (UPF0306 family)